MSRAPVVVIGAGFGGLTAAVELALRGERVVLIEREARPGGKARTVEVAGRGIDVGPTVLTMRWVFDELFAKAGRRLDRAVRLDTADVVARHGFAGSPLLDLYADVDRSAAAIEAFAGAKDADGYRRFAAYSQRIAETVREPFLCAERPSIAGLIAKAGKIGLGALSRIDAHRSMWKALGAHFEDPRLVALFGRYATYVGSSPFEAAATFNLIAHVERESVCTVEGGMSHLASKLADLATELGVEIRYDQRVREIVVQGGRATGVLVEDAASGAREHVGASAVIANADVSSIASGAFGEAVRASVKPASREKRSLSALTWAIVGKASGVPLVHHNVFFSRDYPAEFEAMFGRGKLAAEPTVYLCAQDRPGRDAPAPERDDGNERFFVIVNAPAVADGAPLTNEEVERCERSMLSVLARAGLTLSPRATVVTTPTRFEHLAPGTGGAIYGEAAHGAFAPLSRPSSRTKLAGLYLAGGSVHPGPGVPMASLSGSLCAKAVLEDLGSTLKARTVAMAGSTWTG
jgi:1-hydroxycarotenoid 3,4-desaturase